MVLNEYSNKYSFDMSASFRPLTGIKVLNRTTKNVNIAEKAKVSVPLRGLRFLTAPLTNNLAKPSILQFAGRISFFGCFLLFR
ncbi:hypothetical protein GKG20_10990 [Megasphaera sp. BIOML-A2]|nr:hypothetical protein [Megasphaera sp. BIOML-A2]